MNTLSKVLIGLLAIIAVAVIGFFVYASGAPKRLDVERSVVIDNSPAAVYSQIIDLKNWEKWSPWFAKDSDMEITYGKKTKGEGATYSWKSKTQGNGKLVMQEVRPNEYIKNELLFEQESGPNYGIWNIEETNDKQTKVSWKIESGSDMGVFTRGIMKLLNVEETIKEDFDAGLQNMKAIVEKMPRAESISIAEVEEMEMMGAKFLAIKGTTQTNAESIDAFMGQAYQSIMAKMQEKGMQAAGFPHAFIYNWDEANNVCEMAAAMPITPVADMNKNPVETIKTELGEMRVYDQHVEMDYIGPYEDSKAAHTAINEWIEAHQKEIQMPVIEQYRNDPKEVKPEELHTRILYNFI